MDLERWFRVTQNRWRSVLRRRTAEQELADELAYHLDEETDRRIARGESQADARREVIAAFGGVERRKDECRDVRGFPTIESALKDARYGFTTLRHQPSFTIVAILALTLGTGATTAVFALLDGVLFSRLPYPAPERLVSANVTYPGGAFEAARRDLRSMSVAAYVEGQPVTLEGDGPAIRVTAARVSAELFSVLGADAAVGTVLRAGDDLAGGRRQVVLSHALWQSRFGQSRDAIGRGLIVDGVAHEIAGVMPPSFDFPSRRTQLYIPLLLDSRNTPRYWAGDFMPLIGRLRDGATMAEAQAELRLFQAGVGKLFPWKMPAEWNRTITLESLQERLVGPVRTRLLLLAGAVLFVLVISCANVANLSLSRAATREREIAIRTAIGAGPRRIARQLLIESLVLSSIGAGIGLIVSFPLLTILTRVLPADTPRLAEVAVDWRTMLFTAGLALATGVAFGLAPVLYTLRLRLPAVLDGGGRGGRTVAGWVRSTLAIVQVACAVLLVVSAALLLRSLWKMTHVDPGFRTASRLTAHVAPAESVCLEPARCVAAYRELEASLRAVPGVRAAAFVNTLPLTGAIAKRSIEIQGAVPEPGKGAPLMRLNVVTPDYTPLMDLRLLSGRAFAEADRAGAAVALVSASTARRYWPGRDAVGGHVRFVGESQWRIVIGVVADVLAHDLTRAEPEWIDGTLYVPLTIDATLEDSRLPAGMIAVIDTDLTPAALRAQLARLSPSSGRDGLGAVTLDDVQPLSRVVADASAATAATTSLLGATAGLALVLGSVGVYAVLAFLVSMQTRDFGIRFALGAHPRDVCWLVLREGARLCAIGLILGVGGAAALTRWLSSELYGVSHTDPSTYVVVVATMGLVTFVACLVPAWRAMRVNPLIALRQP
jgi:putative ABC transport system permease protein